ncbi:DUF4376 domain-containing protein [Salmonella enterica subsp. diarizonae]|nr:DUF4376 domain-containing protein [Salmonella enterica subsp. diarizonae]ECI3361213.1 DUF4376 domain-containing protein [Salmonella enterica subsp. diarizonae]
MKIINAKSATYNENGSINVDVLFDDVFEPDGKTPMWLPFTAAEHDPMDYGRQLFDDLKAGKYGPVTPFTATPEMLTAAKTAKHAEINAWRDIQENGDITFTWNNHSWDASKASQDRLTPVLVVAKSGQLPEGFFWTDANNEDVPVTVDDLTAIDAGMTQAMVIQGFKIHERQRRMKEDVDKLTDYDAIRNYTVGWPDSGE